MRLVGVAYVGAFVALLAAFRLQAGTEAPPAVAPPVPSAPTPMAEQLPATATEPDQADEAQAGVGFTTPTIAAARSPYPRAR